MTGLALPFPYVPGDQVAGSFEDRVQQNFDAVKTAWPTSDSVGDIEPLRMFRGNVSSGGTITAGAGFTVAHSATGVYVLTYTPAFSVAPTLLAVTLSSGLYARPGSDGATVNMATFAGSATDGSFGFIAVGF